MEEKILTVHTYTQADRKLSCMMALQQSGRTVYRIVYRSLPYLLGEKMEEEVPVLYRGGEGDERGVQHKNPWV
jgi:hypothetical protein